MELCKFRTNLTPSVSQISLMSVIVGSVQLVASSIQNN
jgi:hypothetical protein